MEFSIGLFSTNHEIASYGLERRVQLPAKEIIVVNRDLITPILLSRDKRNKYAVEQYDKILGLRGKTANKVRIVNAIEDQKFKKAGIYPSITSRTLESLEKLDRSKLIERWKESVGREVYFSKDYYNSGKTYKEFSKYLSDEADVSTLVSSYFLGADIATDESAFSNWALRDFKRDFFERWGTKKRFNKYNSDGLIRLIR